MGISKISIQTGTSHGGVVLLDGTIAKVSVDFDTLLKLSRIARKQYGMGGAVQHGASTLPEDAFSKFVEAEAVEVHLATNFEEYAVRPAARRLVLRRLVELSLPATSRARPNETEDDG